ncbi:MAG: TetR/AcrR family transcriptional regulator [Archangium sp.]|nr:TetR/AcrR family transcriptional regulator [Archangium sp.]
MKRKQRLTAADRRAQLMEVGREVFATQGYEAPIEEIAQRAGVSKPIVYEHFGAKEGLYAAIVDREMDLLVSRVSESISHGTPRERYEGAVLAFMTYTQEQPAGFAVLTRDSPTGLARRGLTRVIDDLAERVDDLFRREFVRAGYDPSTSPIYANALVGMVTQVGQWWAAEGRRFPVAQVAWHVSALGWMGLRHLPRPPKKRKAKQKKKK